MPGLARAELSESFSNSLGCACCCALSLGPRSLNPCRKWIFGGVAALSINFAGTLTMIPSHPFRMEPDVRGSRKTIFPVKGPFLVRFHVTWWEVTISLCSTLMTGLVCRMSGQPRRDDPSAPGCQAPGSGEVGRLQVSVSTKRVTPQNGFLSFGSSNPPPPSPPKKQEGS